MSIIKCNNLTIGYDDKIILSNLNFSINEGSHLYIIGENGSGKSTLVKCLLKLKKPLSGSIEYLKGLNLKEVGYLPQQSSIQQLFPASVYEIVISGCLNRLGFKPFFNRKSKKRANHNMALMEIDNLKNVSYQELSGGQQQRVLLARALCASSKALLLDEPVTGLDPRAKNELYSLIDKLNKEYRITVITVSHDLSAAEKYATHILHLSKNSYYFDTAENYFSSNFYKRFTLTEENNNV